MEKELCDNEFTTSMENEEDDVTEIKECMENGEVLKDPEVGMEFGTLDEYMEYFSNYGYQKGFPVKIRSTERGANGVVKFVILACARSGTSRIQSKNLFKLKSVSKTGCKVKIRAAICADGKLRVTTLTLDHNHGLIPGSSRFYKKNRSLRNLKLKFDLKDEASIGENESFNSFPVEAGGHENVPLSENDCFTIPSVTRGLRLGDGDAMALQNYLKKMQVNNANFFYLMDLDEDDGKLRNVFWADGRSRAAYEEFGDVVTFDTTYLTNKYNLPLALFVGVNHHGQSTLFGCGLILSEDVGSFTWLFKSWLASMNGHAPTAIITDQDEAMKKAIEIVFPYTRRRWCLWHIMKKLPEKLGGCNQYDPIKDAMENAVYDSLTCEEFEGKWNSIIHNFSLQKNNWLSRLYKERNFWVPAFMKGTFWAGMSSPQRSEKLIAFFDGFVYPNTSIKQFVEQYENALRSKVQKENEEDFNSFDRWIPCITFYPLEKQFQDAYTTEIFKGFQNEIKGKIYCAISSIKEECGCQVYNVTEDMFGGTTRRATFSVCFKEGFCDIRCNCLLFEFRGILCKHALTVLLQKQVHTLPEKFFLRRWRKDVKRHHKKIKIIYADWTVNPENERFDKMCKAFYEVADLAAVDEDKINVVICWTKRLLNEINLTDGTRESDNCTPKVGTYVHSGNSGPSAKESVSVGRPLAVHHKGTKCRRN